MLPTFIVAGAKKAATTSLYEYFKEHPEIHMSSIKETNFFAYEANNLQHTQATRRQFPIRTLAEYTELFADVDTEHASGEASPLYISSLTAAHQIHKTIPHVKLIFSLRNPVDRAYSDHQMAVRSGREQRSFEQAFGEDAALLSTKTYYKQLQPWYSLFPHNQIKVILFEDIKHDAASVMQELYTFVAVDPSFLPDFNRRYNTGGLPKNRALQAVLNYLRQYRHLRAYLPETLRNVYTRTRMANLQKAPALSPDTQQMLIELYAEDIDRLAQLAEIDLSAWTTIKG